MKRLFHFLPHMVRVAAVLTAFLLLTAEAPSPWDIDEIVGKKAPDFTLRDLTGKSVSLSSLMGRVVLINFWATWCPPCKSEMPSLSKLQKDFGDKGFVVAAVSTDRSISPVKEFLAKNSFSFLVLTDTENKVSRQFKVFSIPTSFLIDRNGTIVQKYVGEEEWDSPKVRAPIRKILGIP